MRLDGRRESGNIEDRRSDAGGGLGPGGGGFRLPIGRRGGGGGLGLGAIALIVIVGWIAGINPLQLLSSIESGAPITIGEDSSSSMGPGGSMSSGGATTGAPSDTGGAFVAKVLADTEDTWTRIFKGMGRTYTDPTLVLFSGSTRSACGAASAAMGPFYCPNDQKVYIDLAFYDELKSRFHAPGDFAEAYVIAHEIGHHVQNLLGILPKVDDARRRASETQANALSVRLELQADCFAGVWAHEAQGEGILEAGDIDEALNAAAQIGDDTLQKQSQGYVVPDSFTHGTSAQRSRWFKTGYNQGKIDACDTFGAASL